MVPLIFAGRDVSMLSHLQHRPGDVYPQSTMVQDRAGGSLHLNSPGDAVCLYVRTPALSWGEGHIGISAQEKAFGQIKKISGVDET